MPKLIINLEKREKTAFYASDFGKMEVDLHCSLMGIPPSNPPEWYETLKWGAGKGVEMQMLKVLKDSGIVDESYTQEEHGRIDFERGSITVHGYIDAKDKEGFPIEIKSINNKNANDIRNYQNGKPRENYVGQLAVYCDALGLDKGFLFVAAVDGLSTFWFTCERIRDRVFRCGSVEVDLDAEYARWASVKAKVEAGEEPNWFDKLYKYDLTTLDWKTISTSKISSARMGKSVVGDWQVLYSPYKNLIVEKQGATLGYTDDEIEHIRAVTKGYSAK